MGEPARPVLLLEYRRDLRGRQTGTLRNVLPAKAQRAAPRHLVSIVAYGVPECTRSGVAQTSVQLDNQPLIHDIGSESAVEDLSAPAR